MALILREMDRRKEILEEEDRTRDESVFSLEDVKIRNDDLSRKTRYEARNV